jgi:hypothetical protein
MLNGERLAITTGTRDRNLLRALSTWTKLAEPDVIVIVDWGSQKPAREILTIVDDPRIVVVRADVSSWQNSRCHNLEFQAASSLQCNLVLRLDNDALVNPEFFTKHPYDHHSFYAVDCHLVPPHEDDKRNLCGTVMVATKHWQMANGYNERLVQYGYEDEDFYSRLCGNGLTWKNCDLATLDHLPHPNRSRLANLSLNSRLEKMFGHLPPDEADESAKRFLITMSKHLAKSSPWTTDDRMTNWKIDFEHDYGTATPQEETT